MRSLCACVLAVVVDAVGATHHRHKFLMAKAEFGSYVESVVDGGVGADEHRTVVHWRRTMPAASEVELGAAEPDVPILSHGPEGPEGVVEGLAIGGRQPIPANSGCRGHGVGDRVVGAARGGDLDA